jgi:hypothetical protein
MLWTRSGCPSDSKSAASSDTLYFISGGQAAAFFRRHCRHVGTSAASSSRGRERHGTRPPSFPPAFTSSSEGWNRWVGRWVGRGLGLLWCGRRRTAAAAVSAARATSVDAAAANAFCSIFAVPAVPGDVVPGVPSAGAAVCTYSSSARSANGRPAGATGGC